MKQNFRKSLCYATAISICIVSSAHAAPDDIEALMQMPLNDLMKMEVTSVSKTSEKASEAAAAIFVVTQEDIRRSGSNSIPEVLRIVPGMQVARIDSNRWAISSRGFGEQFSKKLLVLIDGRTVYSPLFSGVFWEEQGVPMEDIERIEVIRGPGSTLWGANAVNGVINIITKSAKDTQGTLVTAGVGNLDRDYALARHGGKIGEKGNYRAYVQRHDGAPSLTEDGDHKDDEWGITRTGFRYDGKGDNKDNFTVQGDAYKGLIRDEFDALPSLTGTPTPVLGLIVDADDREKIHGGNLLGRYSKKLEDKSEITVQAYYDLTYRNLGLIKLNLQTADIDFQHAMDIGERHEFIWGLGARNTTFNISDSELFRFTDTALNDGRNLFNAFVQDKVSLVPEKLYLTLGSKLEHNEYTGVEIQPTARLSYLADKNNTIWGAVTRSVRTPSYIEDTGTQIAAAVPFPAYVAVESDDKMASEELIAYEIGYKTSPTVNTSIDVTAFVNDYDRLRTLEATGPIFPDIAASFTADNKAKGIGRGFEIAANWDVTDRWSLAGSYSYLDLDIKLDANSTDILSEGQEGTTPTNMFNIRSHYIINEDLEFSNAVYFNDDVDGSGVDSHDVEEYVRLDAKLTWRPTEGVETSLIGQNLLDDRHQEFGSGIYNSISEVPRAVFGKVSVQF